jgi:hypothetical protein
MTYEQRRAAEIEQDKKTYAAFEAWAAEIAKNLGLGFIAPEEKGWAVNGWLTMGETKIASLAYAKHNGRVEIRPLWPAGTYDVMNRGFGAKLVISVGRSVAPEKAAKDIGRRFLAPYCELSREVNAALDRANAAAGAQAAAFTRVLGAGGYGSDSNILSAYANGSKAEAGFYGLPHSYGKVKIGHGGQDGSIELHSLPTDVIVEIVELLAAKVENGEL